MKPISSHSLSRYIRIISPVILLGLILSCSANTQMKQLPIINFEEGMQKGITLNLSEFCSDIEYIPLQTDTASLLGLIGSHFRAAGDLFYCTDFTQGKNCKVFDNKGTFIKNIGQKGKAPGEFISISDFTFDSDNNNIAILDYQKIVTYNKDGIFIKEIPLNKIKDKKYNIMGMTYFGDSKYCLSIYDFENEITAFAIIDQFGEILYLSDDSLEKPKKFKESINSKEVVAFKAIYPLHTYLFNDNLRILYPKNDTIFQVSQKLEKEPLFVAYMGKYKIEEDESNFKQSITIIHRSVLETENNMFFKIILNGNKFEYNNPDSKIGHTIYNKNTGKLHAIAYDSVSKKTGLKNDIDNGAPFWPTVILETKMYQIVNAIQFIEMSQESGSAKMKEVAAQLNEDSNPVIIIATLK